MVAPTKIIAGLGMSLGIDRLHAPGTTGRLLHGKLFRSNLRSQRSCMASYLGVYLGSHLGLDILKAQTHKLSILACLCAPRVAVFCVVLMTGNRTAAVYQHIHRNGTHAVQNVRAATCCAVLSVLF